MAEEKTVEVKIQGITRETEKAFLVQLEDDEIWVPISQVHKIVREGGNGPSRGHAVAIHVSEWFARKSGLGG